MSCDKCIAVDNGGGAAWDMVPVLEEKEFAGYAAEAVKERGLRVMAFFAVPEQDACRLVAVLGDPRNHLLEISSFCCRERYHALTPEISALHRFEREIAEEHGILPEGHPWLKPVRFRRDRDASSREAPGAGEFFRLAGEGVHEVAVGPIHAGVIEPGHFRFQCTGERVHNLEIALGYQHRGIENMLAGGPTPGSIHLIETASGDSSVAAACAYSLAMEAAADCRTPVAAARLRAIALELERIANHTGDLGALAGDTAFLPTASFCGRIRGEYLNMTARICGNRFGRGIVRPGGSGVTFDAAAAGDIADRLERLYPELDAALKMMFNSPTVLDRLESTGTVTNTHAAALGGVGVAGRASGVKCDARIDFPAVGVSYGGCMPRPAFDIACDGDAVSRARVRQAETAASHYWLVSTLKNDCAPVAYASRLEKPGLLGGMLGVGVVEGWRGEYVCVVLSDAEGRFRKVKLVDPSFHNWSMLAMAMRGEEISNFPICNKSFNLSYCGHDL